MKINTIVRFISFGSNQAYMVLTVNPGQKGVESTSLPGPVSRIQGILLPLRSPFLRPFVPVSLTLGWKVLGGSG